MARAGGRGDSRGLPTQIGATGDLQMPLFRSTGPWPGAAHWLRAPAAAPTPLRGQALPAALRR